MKHLSSIAFSGILITLFMLSAPVHGSSENKLINFKHINSRNGLTQSEVYSFLKDSRGFMWIGTLDGLNRFDGYNIKQFSIDKNKPFSLSNNTIRALAEDKQGNIWIGNDIGIDIYVPTLDKFYKLHVGSQNLRQPVRIFNFLCLDNAMWVASSNGLLLFDTNKLKFENDHLIQNTAVDISVYKRKFPLLSESLQLICKTSDNKIIVGNFSNFNSFEFKGFNISSYTGYNHFSEQIIRTGFDGFKTIIEDKNKNLWLLLTNKGAIRYSVQKKELTYFNSHNSNYNSLTSDITQCAVSDNKGNIWIGTLDNGLNIIPAEYLSSDKIQVRTIKNNALNKASLGGNLIYSLYASKDDNVWVGTIGNGVSYYNTVKRNFQLFRIPPDARGEQNSNFIRSICQDSHDMIWLGLHNDGLFVYDRKIDRFTKIGLGKQSIMHIKEDVFGRNEMLIAAINGFYVFNDRTYQQLKFSNALFKQGFLNVMQTDANSYWLAGIDGIYQLTRKGNQFEIAQTLTDKSLKFKIPENNTRVFAYDAKRNQLWAGSEGGGLFQLALDNNQKIKKIAIFNTYDKYHKSITNNYIRALCLQGDKLWVGTYDGLNVLNLNNPQAGFSSYSTLDGLPNNMIQSIESHKNKLWIGTNGGLSCFDTKSGKFINYNYSDGLQSNEFSEHTSFSIKGETMLFGGIDGFNIFNPDKIHDYETTPSVVITDISVNNQVIAPYKKIEGRVITKKQIFGNDTLRLKYTENNIRIEFASPFFTASDKVKYRFKLEGYDKSWQVIPTNMRFISYTNLSYGSYNLLISASNGVDKWNEPTFLLIDIQTPFYFTWWAILLYVAIFLAFIYYLTNYSIIEITEKNKLLLEHEHSSKIEELNEQRTRFFINISHELRTPLTLIVGPLKRIIAEKKIDVQPNNELNIVLRNAQRLKILTDQLLDFRKLEVGALQLNKSNINIVELIEKTVANFLSAFVDKKISFKVEKNQNEILLSVDVDKFEKAICNILSNALKHTPVGGEAGVIISIESSEADASQFIINLYDSGAGIPEKDRNKVFDRFYAANNDKSGYGIGLHFAREIVLAHSGEIKATESHLGGASIIISLPVEIAEDATNQSIISDNSFSDIISQTIVSEQDIVTEFSEEKPIILVVEDNSDLRHYLTMLLQADYNVLLAEDGEVALNLLNQINPDLVLSDIMMPNISGIELCEKIKSNIDTSHIPVVLLTARDDIETKFSGYDKGADAYILKPFDDDFLMLRIKKMVERRDRMRADFKKNNQINQVKTELNSLDQRFVDRVIRFVDENLHNEDFSINSLESLVGVSHSSMFRKMKALFGMTSIEFLQNRRLTKAAELLASGNFESISDVAYNLGYSNPKYFSKCFKEKFGISPSEYRL